MTIEEPPLEFHQLFDLVGGDGLADMLPQVEDVPNRHHGGLGPTGAVPDMMMMSPPGTTEDQQFMDEKCVTEHDAIINHPKRQGKVGQQRWMSDEFRGERRKITSEDCYLLVQRFEAPQTVPGTQQYNVGRILYMCKQSNGDVLYRKATEEEIKKNVNSNRNKKGSGGAGGKGGKGGKGKSTSGNKRQKPSEPVADEFLGGQNERTLRDEIEDYHVALRELEGAKCLVRDYRAQSFVFRKTLDAFMALPFADDIPGSVDTTIEFHGYYQIRRTLEIMWDDLCKGYGYNTSGLFMAGTSGGGGSPRPPYSGSGGGAEDGFGGFDGKSGGSGGFGGGGGRRGGHSPFGPSGGGGYQGGGWKECADLPGEDDDDEEEESSSSENESGSEVEEESEFQGGGKSLVGRGHDIKHEPVLSALGNLSLGKQFDHVEEPQEKSDHDSSSKQQDSPIAPDVVESSRSAEKQDEKNASDSKPEKQSDADQPYREFNDLVQQIEDQIKASSSDDDLGGSTRMLAEVVLNFMDGHINDEEAQIYGLKLVWERCKGKKIIESFISVNAAGAIVRSMGKFKESKKLQKNACGALWSLCIDAATTVKLVQADACEQVVGALDRFATDKSVARYAMGALRTLSTDKEGRKSCHKLNASEAVVRAMGQQKSNLDIQKHGCAFLSNCATDKELGSTVAVPPKQMQAVVHAMLTHHKDASVMSAGCVALKSYTGDPKNLTTLCQCDGIKDLCFRLGENQKFSSTSYRADATAVLGRIASSRVEEPGPVPTDEKKSYKTKIGNEEKKLSAFPADSKKQARGTDADAKAKARPRSAASSSKASEKILASRAGTDASAEVVTRKKEAFTGRLGQLGASAARAQEGQ